MTLPGPGMFIKSEWTAPNGTVFEMQHRYEDRALILDVLQGHRPWRAVELGTAKGGFSALLAETVAEWGGTAVTFDKTPEPGVFAALRQAYPNIAPYEEDVLDDGKVTQATLTGTPHPLLLYCDNGNKVREIELYAPLLQPGDLLGTHDYSTEVPVEWVEPFLAGLGFTPHRHDEFAALADPMYYPASLTRFWVR